MTTSPSKGKLNYSTSPKVVKDLIAKVMNDRKTRVSVELGEIDCNFDRILIHYPNELDVLSLNPITNILRKTNFFIAQIVDFWKQGKHTVLICRGYKSQ